MKTKMLRFRIPAFLLILTFLLFSFREKAWAQLVPPKQNSSVETCHYQLGLGFEQGNKRSSISILGTISYKRWSINTGLTIANIANGHFKNESDFRQQTGLDFKKVYFPNAVDTLPSANINYSNTLFQIPITLAYTIPLKNNYTFIVGLGTDIDIYANQRTYFEQKVNNNPTLYQQEDTSLTAVSFNNIVISSGFQKTWNGFSLQLLPFVSPQLKHVNYKKEDLYAGFKLRAYYNF